jgi:vancomycin resistance protein YoaR
MVFLPQHEMLKEDIAKTRSRTAELQVQANEETEHKQKTEEELTRVEACLQESQNFLAESNKTHEVLMLEVTKEKCEVDEELKNAQLELQNSIVSHDRMVQVRNQIESVSSGSTHENCVQEMYTRGSQKVPGNVV